MANIFEASETQERIIIKKSVGLSGEIKVHGAKNAVLPIIAASLIGRDQASLIEEVPDLEDVRTLYAALEHLGVKVKYEKESLHIDSTNLSSTEPDRELVQKMRASFLLMGALLARTGHVKIYLPGGCAIGARPIDQHLKGFQALGATIKENDEYIEAFATGRLTGATIYLDVPSVGATENIMMAATTAFGQTIIENSAQEPEIVDLANYLNSMGAKVKGAGTNTIRIEGVDKLVGARHAVIPDRIETGSFMTIAAATRGEIFLKGAIGNHLRAVIAKLIEAGVSVHEDDDGILVHAVEPLKPLQIKTLPYPGFPTDMQAQFTALLTTIGGTSTINETVFENRFMHCAQLRKMGANIEISGRNATIIGGNPLYGAEVAMTDLRAGAAMILAGLVAEGTTEVTHLHHIDRGYVDIVGKLNKIGADIRRINPEQIRREIEDIDNNRTIIYNPTYV